MPQADTRNGYLAPADEVFLVLTRLADLYEAQTRRLEAAEAVFRGGGRNAFLAWQQAKAEHEKVVNDAKS